MKGPLACLASAALWALAVTLFRPLIRRYGPWKINLGKGSIALVAFVFALLALGQLHIPSSSQGMGSLQWITLIGAATLGMAMGDTLILAAAHSIGAQRTFLIQCLSPIASSLLAFAFLQETLSLLQGTGILLTILGLTLVIRMDRTQKTKVSRKGYFMALGAMLCQSLGIVLNKPSLRVMDAAPNAALRIAISLIGIFILIQIFDRKRSSPLLRKDSRSILRLLIASLLGTFLGFFLFILGIQNTKAGIASALTSTTPIFAIPFAWALEGTRPQARSIFGTLVTVMGAVFTILG
jgi:drug/metabolite transporter (DMT)-like permease